MEIQLGLIYIDNSLIAVALFKNSFCIKYSILEDLAKEKFRLYGFDNLLPEILTKEDGILGFHVDQYNFIAEGSDSSFIRFEKVRSFTKETLLEYFNTKNISMDLKLLN